MHAVARKAGLSFMLVLPLLAACAGAPPGTREAHRAALRIANPISAYAMWIAHGDTRPTGTEETSSAGVLLAQVYMQVSDRSQLFGPIAMSLPFGWMACPMTLNIVGERPQKAYGRCTITVPDQGQLFADIVCSPTRTESCDGSFRLIGGTDHYRGAIGGGPLRIQPASQDIILAGREFGAAPSCRSPFGKGDSIDALSYIRAQPAGLADQGCRLERLPFVPVDPAFRPQPVAMRE